MPLETEPVSPAERIEQRKVEAWKDVIQRDSASACDQNPDQKTKCRCERSEATP